MMEAASNCSHIISALTAKDSEEEGEFVKKYKSVVSWYSHRTNQTHRPSKRRKIAAPTCGTCDIALARPFVCSQCSYAGCWSDGHVVSHLKESAHTFSVDAKSGSVYCSECNNFIYHSKLDTLYLATIVTAEEKQMATHKHKESFKPWSPSPKEIQALEGAEPVACQGRRGLLNLGQTCYLNVVLQCLAHNPLLRNYFLSDKHNYRQCKIEEEKCTSCEMDKLFTEIYSDNARPYGPVTFLATTWKASAELSGYAQQDAHEFFISTLNQIHSTSRASTNVSCNCIIHSTFAGQLQSDVKCERCHNVTSTVDPMLDISLELKGKAGDIASAENTLGACLRRFTQPEKLGPKEYSCGKCGKAAHEASKRLSIRKLPPVLSFQFKSSQRFEHKTNDKSSARKIDSAIRFPASLNMAPFTTLAMKENEKENSGSAVSYPGPEAMYEYDLFAVINHEGQINNGHYTNYARFNDEWYRFDDDKVSHSSFGACLNSAAYMCFYVKRHLDYKPITTPSYVLMRETEAAREKELEKEKELARMKELEDDLLSTV
ncbi:cysteine proteinase [Phlegmacium glaucopus]|nr:cysteine proteinase [Phlegmacium glaucopus]